MLLDLGHCVPCKTLATVRVPARVHTRDVVFLALLEADAAVEELGLDGLQVAHLLLELAVLVVIVDLQLHRDGVDVGGGCGGFGEFGGFGSQTLGLVLAPHLVARDLATTPGFVTAVRAPLTLGIAVEPRRRVALGLRIVFSRAAR